MDNMITLSDRSNEYSFHWGKPFSFLTLRPYNTKLVINNTNLVIETEKHYLGFMKGKTKTRILPISSVSSLDTKKLLSWKDLVIAAVFLCAGFLINPLLFLIVPLAIWACINTNIILSTKDSQSIRIPCYSKEEAQEFVRYFNDIFLES